MADLLQAKKKITFTWVDEEHHVNVNITLPRAVVENFFKGELLEFAFHRDNSRIAVKQGRKGLIIQ